MGDSAIAQGQRTMTFDAETSLMLREFNAMLVENDEGIQVELILGGHTQSADPMSDELQQGDLILMMNGKRVSAITQMRADYESINEDDEIKIGVRRGNERFILTAIKGDVPETGPGQMVLSIEGAGANPPVLVPELGLLLTNEDDTIIVQALLDPILPDVLKEANLEGFTVITINGKTFDDANAVQNYLTELAVGDTIDLVVENNGDQKVFTFNKTEPRGGIRMNIDN